MAKKNTHTENEAQLTDFNFPAHDITVQARDIQEAEEKLKQILNQK